jgi:hypothetical protein
MAPDRTTVGKPQTYLTGKPQTQLTRQALSS